MAFLHIVSRICFLFLLWLQRKWKPSYVAVRSVDHLVHDRHLVQRVHIIHGCYGSQVWVCPPAVTLSVGPGHRLINETISMRRRRRNDAWETQAEFSSLHRNKNLLNVSQPKQQKKSINYKSNEYFWVKLACCSGDEEEEHLHPSSSGFCFDQKLSASRLKHPELLASQNHSNQPHFHGQGQIKSQWRFLLFLRISAKVLLLL